MDKELINSRLNIQRFYQSLLPSLKENGKAQTIGLCPFHDDHSPSLSVNLKNGLYNCFACGAKGDVFTFYQKHKGVDFPTSVKEIGGYGILDTTIKPQVVAKFGYKDLKGKTIYIKERLEPGRDGRKKEFRFKYLTGNKWVFGRDCNPVPYNLPDLSKSKYTFIVEGEGKADLLKKWGIVATCLDSGANSPWKDEYMLYFKDKEKVVILPDNDSSGRSYTSTIAHALHGKVGIIKVLELQGLKEKEDILDWIKTEGNDKAKLIKFVEQAYEWTPEKDDRDDGGLRVVSIAEFLSMEFPPRENVIDPWLPTQGLAMIYAPRGVGKTHVSLGIAVAVSAGDQFLRWKSPKPRGVLFIDGEMPAITNQERLSHTINSMDKEPSAPLLIITPDLQNYCTPNLATSEGQAMLEPHLKYVSLVILDNISTLCRGGKENEADSWLIVQEWVLRLRSRGLSVLFIHHAGKSGQQRGTSRREDILDTVINLRHAQDYTPDQGAKFEIHLEVSRGSFSN